jgi:hypothetical protein
MSSLNELATITSWSPNAKHVDQKIQEGVSTSSSDILMAVGPSRLSEATGQYFAEGTPSNRVEKLLNSRLYGDSQISQIAANVRSVGAIGSATVTQNRPTKVVYEIGSKLQYNVPTNTSGSISLSRVFLNGASLMKALYAFKSEAEILDLTTVDDRPGQMKGELWINMASSLFDQPIGIMLWMKNNKKKNVGAYYFENCSVQGLSFALYAAGGVFSEGTQIIFDKIRPIELTLNR